MKIRLLSDLHHECFEDPYRYINFDKADVLVVAGDLAVGHLACWTALHQFAEYHEHVVYIPGNHEYYGNRISEFDEYITKLAEGTNVHFLNPGMIKIKDVTFIGATLWTNFQEDLWAKQSAARSISDFRVITGFSPEKAVDLHTEHIKFIKEAYATAEGKKVIVTHFLPAIECISKEYLTKGNDTLNKYFANDYGNWISDLKNTPYWLFGHTHDNIDVTIGDTRVIANPYGYNENKRYSERVIQL